MNETFRFYHGLNLSHTDTHFIFKLLWEGSMTAKLTYGSSALRRWPSPQHGMKGTREGRSGRPSHRLPVRQRHWQIQPWSMPADLAHGDADMTRGGGGPWKEYRILAAKNCCIQEPPTSAESGSQILVLPCTNHLSDCHSKVPAGWQWGAHLNCLLRSKICTLSSTSSVLPNPLRRCCAVAVAGWLSRLTESRFRHTHHHTQVPSRHGEGVEL